MEPDYFRSKIEPFLHGWSLGYPFTTAIVCVVLDLFGPSNEAFCWIGDMNCNTDQCMERFLIFTLAFGSVGVIVSLLITVFCFILIFDSFREIFASMRRQNLPNARQNQSSDLSLKMKESATQGMLYIGAFIITHVWSCVVDITIWTQHNPSKILLILSAIFYPLQGFWNFLIFARPKANTILKHSPDKSYFWAVQMVIFHPKVIRNA